jgi:Uroporphyrinogen-III synthase
MNIVDTRARNTFNFVKRKNIKNIPLFELSFLDHSIDISSYTDVIFQSTPSVEFFNHHKDLIDKNVFAMGPGTQSSLGTKGISSKIPEDPGSEGLKKLIKSSVGSGKFLIVKGQGGLNIISDYLKAEGAEVDTIQNYQRVRFSSYLDLSKDFDNADFVIFPSRLAAEIYFQEIYNPDINSKFVTISSRIKDYVDSLGFENSQLDYFADNFESEILNLT